MPEKSHKINKMERSVRRIRKAIESFEPELPDKLKSFEDKLSYLTDQLSNNHKNYILHDSLSVVFVYRQGHLLLAIKTILKSEKKVSFAKYALEKLPFIAKKRRQRYMAIAKKVNLADYPNLAFLGQARLLQLSAIAKKDSINRFLGENDIDLKFDATKMGAIDRFKERASISLIPIGC